MIIALLWILAIVILGGTLFQKYEKWQKGHPNDSPVKFFAAVLVSAALIGGLVFLLCSCSNPFSVDIQSEDNEDSVVFAGKVTHKGAPLGGCVVEVGIIEKIYGRSFGTIKDRRTLTKCDTTDERGRYWVEVDRRFEPLWWKCRPFHYPQGTVEHRGEYEACLEENKDYYNSEKTLPECWGGVWIIATWGQEKEQKWVSVKKEPQTTREFELKWGLPRIDTHPPDWVTMIPVVEERITTDFIW